MVKLAHQIFYIYTLSQSHQQLCFVYGQLRFQSGTLRRIHQTNQDERKPIEDLSLLQTDKETLGKLFLDNERN